MKIQPVGPELFHADRQTDMTKVTVAFGNFANAPKNSRACDRDLSPSVHSTYFDPLLRDLRVNVRSCHQALGK
jgi:hypothetical protein